MTLTSFLLARIADDEAVARAATPGPWRWDHTPADGWGHQPPDLVTVAEETRTHTLNSGEQRSYIIPVGMVISSWGHDADGVNVDDEDAAHIARHDPARVLAECEAKRQIVASHPLDHSWQGDRFKPVCMTCRSFAPCDTLRHLATVHADHPDYREEWSA